MADHATTYNHGDMDIQEQVATFQLVMGLTKWASLILAAALLWLVMWFCTPTGFMGAAATGLAVLVLGVLLLRDGKKAAH